MAGAFAGAMAEYCNRFHVFSRSTLHRLVGRFRFDELAPDFGGTRRNAPPSYRGCNAITGTCRQSHQYRSIRPAQCPIYCGINSRHIARFPENPEPAGGNFAF